MSVVRASDLLPFSRVVVQGAEQPTMGVCKRNGVWGRHFLGGWPQQNWA